MLLALACLHLSLFQRNLFLYIVLSFLSWFITVICDPWIKTQQCFTCYTHVLTAFVNTDRGERLILPAWNVLHIARWNLTISSQNSISLVFFLKKYPVATHVCCTSTHHTAQNLKMWFFLYFLWATNDTFLTWSPLRGNTKRPRIYLLFVLSQHHDTNSLNENWTFKEMYVIIFLRYWNLHVVLQIRFCAKKINVQ